MYTKIPTLDALASAVIEASLPIKRGFGIPVSVEKKSDGTKVTAVDMEVHNKLLLWSLQYPQLGYIGEEGNRFPKGCRHVLCVDPLDGTHSFLRGKEVVTTIASILKQREDGLWETELAVIHDPLTCQTWVFEKGQPSYSFNVLQSRSRLVRGHVRADGPPFNITVSTWSGVPHNLDKIETAIKDDDRFIQEQHGGIGFTTALMASGKKQAILFASPSAVEAVAMGPLIANCSGGGIVTDLYGSPIDGFELGEVKGKLDFRLPRGIMLSSHQAIKDELVRLVLLYN